jgi:DNA-directed RNA polymerase subunit RPC12/RpoP
MIGSNIAASDSGAGWAILGLSLGPLILLFVVWVACAAVAGAIAEGRGRSFAGFFAVTFFFLGPLGPGFALLAGREYKGVPIGPLPPRSVDPERRKVADGRRRFTCPRCGADNDIPEADTSYDCWRCNEHRAVKPRATKKS